MKYNNASFSRVVVATVVSLVAVLVGWQYFYMLRRHDAGLELYDRYSDQNAMTPAGIGVYFTDDDDLWPLPVSLRTRLSSVNWLSVYNANLSMADCHNIAFQDKLAVLEFADCRGTHAAWRQLDRLSGLNVLAISASNIPPDVLKRVLEGNKLQELYARGCNFGLVGSSAPGGVRFDRLKVADLGGADISDGFVKLVCTSGVLRTLLLEDTRLTDDGCHAIAAQPSTTACFINRTAVTNTGIGLILDTGRITHFGASGDSSLLRQIAESASAPRLQWLYLDINGDVSVSLPYLLEKCPCLRVLRLRGCHATGKSLAAVLNHTHLRCLDLREVDFDSLYISQLLKGQLTSLIVSDVQLRNRVPCLTGSRSVTQLVVDDDTWLQIVEPGSANDANCYGVFRPTLSVDMCSNGNVIAKRPRIGEPEEVIPGTRAINCRLCERADAVQRRLNGISPAW